jgi:signal transduction histidine kinase
MAGATPSLLARARALPPFRLDLLLGVVVLAEGALEVLLMSRLDGERVLLGLLVSLLVAVAVALRRRRTFAAILLVFGAMLLAQLLGPDLTDHSAGIYFVSMFITGTAGYVLEGRRLWLAGALALTFSSIGSFTDEYGDNVASVLFEAGLGVIGPMLLGQLLRNRTRLNEALHEKAARLEREQAEDAEAAAAEERTRIAGELHDVVAHALSAMTVQASAARRLATRDPDRAREAFATAEGTGREALTELRRLLGVLRREDEDVALAPQPSLAHVGELTRRAASAGLPTALHTDGTPRPIPAGVDLTAYRVVQEALNTARTAGGARRAQVAIHYRGGDVVVEVTDDGTQQPRRLLGMRERVAVYGGELTTASLPAGGWSVAARLPLEAPS